MIGDGAAGVAEWPGQAAAGGVVGRPTGWRSWFHGQSMLPESEVDLRRLIPSSVSSTRKAVCDVLE